LKKSKLIVTSLIVVILITGLYGIYTSSKLDFEEGILGFGATFTFFGLLLNFILWASSLNKNNLRWMKERLKLEVKIVGMTPKQKILEEIKLLEIGQFHGRGRMTAMFINRYESMSLAKARKIGTEPELMKLRRTIRLTEETFPFCYNVLVVSGISLILIAQFISK